MLEQLAQYLPEEHRNTEGLLAVATSSQVLPELLWPVCLGYVCCDSVYLVPV